MDLKVHMRRALEDDAVNISNLYETIYEGTYPDPLMKDIRFLKGALRSEEYCWMVGEFEGKIVASMVYRIDHKNKIAKAYGAVVAPAFRGKGLTQKLMSEGYGHMRDFFSPVEVTYATTRTVSIEPQKLTANLGYKKLGIFPNVHKTDNYETHCLAAFYSEEAFAKRYSDFTLHPKLEPLFEIVRRECQLPSVKFKKGSVATKSKDVKQLALEAIEAPLFVQHRFRLEKPGHDAEWFYPFEEPNILLTSPDQSLEAFIAYSHLDKHCVLIGIRDPMQIGLAQALTYCTQYLRNMGARYIEFLICANETDKIQAALDSNYIPSAYFPAMQLFQGVRYDVVVFSQSFEILDFHETHVDEKNIEFLKLYYKYWQEIALKPLKIEKSLWGI